MLPDVLRPRGFWQRKLVPGLHFPTGFIEDLKAIDEHLWLVWHPYRVMYDDVMNQYTGSLEDPRFDIHGLDNGMEVWGFTPTHQGAPIPEQKWHIWRLCWPYGWCHIAPIQANDANYLGHMAHRLHLQATTRNRYGDRAWNKKLEADEQEKFEADAKRTNDLFDAVATENKWLTKRVQENFERGIVAPTRPTKDIITSFSGQTNRTKIVRPIDDKEGGLIIPETW